jgi:DNA-binding response OmpR family regulator
VRIPTLTERRWRHGKLAVFDISESGDRIAEKLLVLLNTCQRQELVNYLINSQKLQNDLANSPCAISENYRVQTAIDEPFTEIRIGDLYFCQEQRIVCIGEQVIELTAKEFDILALLITHQKRVFTYELIMELVWNEDYSYYSRKAVNNHVSNLRKKLKVTQNSPDYIKSVVGVGYKFEMP